MLEFQKQTYDSHLCYRKRLPGQRKIIKDMLKTFWKKITLFPLTLGNSWLMTTPSGEGTSLCPWTATLRRPAQLMHHLTYYPLLALLGTQSLTYGRASSVFAKTTKPVWKQAILNSWGLLKKRNSLWHPVQWFPVQEEFSWFFVSFDASKILFCAIIIHDWHHNRNNLLDLKCDGTIEVTRVLD